MKKTLKSMKNDERVELIIFNSFINLFIKTSNLHSSALEIINEKRMKFGKNKS